MNNRKPVMCGGLTLPFDESCATYGVEFDHELNPRVTRSNKNERKWVWYLALPDNGSDLCPAYGFLNCDVKFNTAQEAANHMNETLKMIGKVY